MDKEKRQEIKKRKEEHLLRRKELEKQYVEMLKEQERKLKEPKNAPEGCYVSLQGVNKVYENLFQAVHNFNLEIKEHELIVFVGPSGCGKSTTLRMIAGLEAITTGDLFIDGKYCNELSSKQRDVAMVFQSYALYPHMSVYENMAFGLQIRNYSKEEIDARVRRAAEILQISELLKNYPKELSGGQKQRVALGRAIVRESKLFLMDEPLSNLDAKLRVSMRSEIIKLHKQLNATTIYVTHDQTEAMTMASRIVVMKKGVIQQIGTPEEVYESPANKFVASFIGAPAMNLIPCLYKDGIVDLGDGNIVQLSQLEKEKHDSFYQTAIEETEKLIVSKAYEIPDFDALLTHKKEGNLLKRLFSKTEEPLPKGPKERLEDLQGLLQHYQRCLEGEHSLILGIRPENIHLEGRLPIDIVPTSLVPMSVSFSELLGSEYQIHLLFQSHELIAKSAAKGKIEDGSTLKVAFDSTKIHLFDELDEKSII